MRSADRCKEHYEGDRCRKGRHHSSNLIASPDPIHVGNFNNWTGEGDRKVLKARFQKKSPKRNRIANRSLRAICAKEFNPRLVPGNERKAVLWHLTQLAKYFRGERE